MLLTGPVDHAVRRLRVVGISLAYLDGTAAELGCNRLGLACAGSHPVVGSTAREHLRPWRTRMAGALL